MKILRVDLRAAVGPGSAMTCVSDKVSIEYVDKPAGLLISGKFLIPIHMVTHMLVEKEVPAEDSVIKQKVRKMSE